MNNETAVSASTAKARGSEDININIRTPKLEAANRSEADTAVEAVV